MIAAGAVPLTLAAFVIDLRMAQWSTGVRFIVVGVIASVLLIMGWEAELEEDAPRPYHSILLVAGLLVTALSLELFASLLGAAHPAGAGGQVWIAAVIVALAVAGARHANSRSCTFLAAIAGLVLVEAAVNWISGASGLGVYRTFAVLVSVGYATGAVVLRDHQRPHAVQLINVIGLTALALAFTYVFRELFGIARPLLAATSATGAPFGWLLYLLAVGFGLLAYGGADRERGPAIIGVAVLAAFALLAGPTARGSGSLLGWPIFLLLLGAVGMSVGLRPRDPLPPPPQADDATPIPLHRVDGG